MLDFDEQWLLTRLRALPRPARAGFAAACAERLMPSYQRFSERTGRGDPGRVRAILDDLWAELHDSAAPGGKVQDWLGAAMELISREDEGAWIEEQAAADDCVTSLAYALRCWQSGE